MASHLPSNTRNGTFWLHFRRLQCSVETNPCKRGLFRSRLSPPWRLFVLVTRLVTGFFLPLAHPCSFRRPGQCSSFYATSFRDIVKLPSLPLQAWQFIPSSEGPLVECTNSDGANTVTESDLTKLVSGKPFDYHFIQVGFTFLTRI